MVKYLCKIFDEDEVYIQDVISFYEIGSYLQMYLINLRYDRFEFSVVPIEVSESISEDFLLEDFNDLPF